MASPITPFVAIRAFAGVPIEDLDINRSPVETVFQGRFYHSSKNADLAPFAVNRVKLPGRGVQILPTHSSWAQLPL